VVALRSAWACFTLVALVLLLGPPIILLAPLRRGELSMALGRFGSRIHRWSAGARLRVEGREVIPSGVPCVFVANHQGTFDSHAMMEAVPPPVRVLAKKELFKIPIFGWGLYALGFPKVDRGDSETARAQMRRATAEVGRRCISIFGFPEGTRNTGRSLLRFKKGLFVLAIELGMPVVPVLISGSRAVQGRKTLVVRPGLITVRFLEPIPTAGMTYEDRNRLIDEARRVIEENLAPEDR
jgi:1-acyl-sn-glycerol-3-phosphate acyltransferase